MKITNVRPADENNVVLSVEGGRGGYRKQPCAECPWRKENDGSFPAEAFRHSAETAYDMAVKTFGCHMSGQEAPTACAGFILASDHNMAIRMAYSSGRMNFNSITDGGADLHQSYRSMAEANGVDSDDPVLKPCR